MNITKRSPLTGIETTLDLPVTPAQLARWKNGGLIQDCFPNLTPEQREFMISGLAPGEFEEMFGRA
jgi:hypothetical protein